MAGLTVQPGEKDPRKIADTLRQVVEGRNNAVGTFTLTTGATTTLVVFPNCAPTSNVFWNCASTNAQLEPTMSYVSQTGQFIVNHTSSTNAHRTFGFAVFG